MRLIRKLRYINEERFRQRLTEEEGFPFARNFKFDSLAELAEWIGGKLNRRSEEKANRLEDDCAILCGEIRGIHGFGNQTRKYRLE